MRIKLDNRIRTLIENGIIIRHRSMFVIIGEKARDQVATLYQIMVKASTAQRPTTDDSFEQFILSTHINYCYYSESQRILGNTFGMAVLQDFEALTPNLLARTIETVEGGGLVVLLLQNMHSLKQLYTLTMDVHKRYRTELHSEIIPRFNERFTLSLSTCSNCFVIDDHLNVLPIFSNALNITPLHPNQKNDKSPKQLELQQLKQSLGDSKPIGPLLAKCKTYCQGKVLLQLLDASMEKTNLNSICSITAARGRGKSTAMGLAVAGTIGLGFSNICVTSPTPENLKTFFEFVLKGFEAIGYQEHADFEVVKSLDPAMDKCIVKINVFRRHRQTIQYITPTDFGKLLHAELVVIDEAAAIPMPLVKKLINGSNLVFLASTISGYEGSGRSLSLKLLEQLRKQQINNLEKEENNKNKKRLFELTLDESIRYGNGDPAAHYKNSPDDLQLLSDAPAHHLFVLMSPIASDQNYVPQIMAVIQICLEGAISKQTVASKQGKKVAGDLIPWTICQQFLDNEFSLLYGARIGMGYGSAAVRMLQKYFKGDFGLIENLENEKLKKERDEKINKPVEEEEDMEGIEEEIIEEEEEEENEEEDNTSNLTPRTNLPPLLERLNQRRAESLDYIGVSFGLTLPLLKFWKRCNFVPLYIRQSKNGLTGEHNCIMINTITIKDEEKEKNLISQTINSDGTWLLSFFEEFRKRFISLLGICFNDFSPHMAFSLLCINSTGSGGFDTMNLQKNKKPISRQELNFLLSDIDLLRLSHYSRNMTDFNLISDLLPIIANIYFNGRLEGKQNSTSFSLDLGQAAILLGVGLQRKSVDMVAKELELPVEQGYALLNKAIRRLSTHFDTICRDSIELDSIMEEQPESKNKRVNE
uniref:RNA cytidine acetyltransferase n=1 Tax=Meloidogyne hapla TaxID=6305 RepID=A0A1I8C298_MELHA